MGILSQEEGKALDEALNDKALWQYVGSQRLSPVFAMAASDRGYPLRFLDCVAVRCCPTHDWK